MRAMDSAIDGFANETDSDAALEQDAFLACGPFLNAKRSRGATAAANDVGSGDERS